MHGNIESALRVEWRPLAELASIAEEWRALAGRALEPNVFYEPDFALAAAPVLGADVGVGLVWSRAQEPARLFGFFPARIERRRYGLALPVLVGWAHAYGNLGAPLVDRDVPEVVVAAWLAHAANDPQLPDVMLLPFFPQQRPLTRAFDAAVGRHGAASTLLGGHMRALLAPPGVRGRYVERALGRKRGRELRRLRKRLGDIGKLTSTSTSEPRTIAHALNEFFALEAAGWKGRAGTAASADAHVLAFMQQAVGALAHEGKVRIARLCMGGRPIAALVTLRSGDTAWCWKIAYDEAYARYSPGVQLLLDETHALLDDPTLARADSCAIPDHPMMDHVWRERLALADRMLWLGSSNQRQFALACKLERLRRATFAGAKAIRDAMQ